MRAKLLFFLIGFMSSILLLTTSLFAQLLVEEFDFSGNLVDNGWTQHSGSTDIIATTTGLTYSGYVSSGIGNAALVDGTSQDVNRTFTAQTSGTVYASFLLNVSSNGTNYFFHLATSTVSSFKGRIFCTTDGTGDFEFGLTMAASTPDDTTDNDYSFGTTYLVVLKYEFNVTKGGGTGDVTLFVFDSGVPGSEPGTPTLGPFLGADASNIGSVALRQSSGIANVTIDGIRVGTSWLDAPLPVELTSFSHSVVDRNVSLKWATATETNNFGFDVERKVFDSNWGRIGFVEGKGTTTKSQQYGYVDANVAKGHYEYRLKQVDLDGAFEFSNVLLVSVG